jgi:hypothetical protein
LAARPRICLTAPAAVETSWPGGYRAMQFDADLAVHDRRGNASGTNVVGSIDGDLRRFGSNRSNDLMLGIGHPLAQQVGVQAMRRCNRCDQHTVSALSDHRRLDLGAVPPSASQPIRSTQYAFTCPLLLRGHMFTTVRLQINM